MKKIAFILALVMILNSALWGCDTAETDTTGQAKDGLEDTSEIKKIEENLDFDLDTSLLYKDLLDTYIELQTYGKNGDVSLLGAKDYPKVSPEIFSTLQSVAMNSYVMGYARKDLNKDGVPELILLNVDYEIFAIFTVSGGKLMTVDTFYSNNHIGAIDSDGTVYKSGYSKGESGYCSVKTLSAFGELTGLSFGSIDSNDEIKFYKTVDDENVYITEQELKELSATYSHIFSDMQNVTANAGLTLELIVEYDPK